MPRNPSENPSEQALIRRKQREAKKLGIAKPKGRAKQCELAKTALKTDKPKEMLEMLMKNRKISVAGLKKCYKEDRIDETALNLLKIKFRKKKDLKGKLKPATISSASKKAVKKEKPKKETDEKPRGSKAGGGGGGGGQPPQIADKLVQSIAPSQPQEPIKPIDAFEYLNRRREEAGLDRLTPLTREEIARAKSKVAETIEKEFGVDPHQKRRSLRERNPLSTHDNVAGTTREKAKERNSEELEYPLSTIGKKMTDKEIAEKRVSEVVSNVAERVDAGVDKKDIRFKEPIQDKFVLRSEPTQPTLQSQTGFNMGSLSAQKTIEETIAEQDRQRELLAYNTFDHSTITPYANHDLSDLKKEEESEEESEEEESEATESDVSEEEETDDENEGFVK